MQVRILIATTVALTAWGCGSGGNSSGGVNAPTAPTSATMVTIVGQKADQSFSPNPAPIQTGTMVEWRNADAATHRIVMNDGSWDSGVIAPGATSQGMRLAGGGGGYHCALHPSMVGSINVPTMVPPPGMSPY